MVERLVEHDVEFDADTYLTDEGQWKFYDELPTYLDEVAEDITTVRNGEDLSYHIMHDATKDMRKLFDESSYRTAIDKSLTSWELEKIEKLISSGADGMPSTTKTFDTISEIGPALEANHDAMYDLSDAGAAIFDAFRDGNTKQRRAIILMVQAAQYVEQGVAIPRSLTQKLKRVRTELKDEGWTLDTTMLR